ncbi:YraN family protein [Candidatus Falkowbacteria bacterium]|jgi:putative endonuclease|nr:YraN family protein [Candidatus Falkowbacteria bacterium]MBT4433171.1 YraN family protein [Candidatus Falkowbacteria bacterium]
MLNESQRFGNWGEDVVCKYLLDNGYKILERNYKNYYGEIDIIVKLKSKIIFIEVKTRSSRKFGLPEESVNQKKQQKILRASEKYILDNKIKKECRIDVVTIEKDYSTRKINLRHFKNAIRYF